MLACACDLIIASEDAFFADPVLRMGAPGVEYFAHPFQMAPRFAKEFLFLGERVSAERARELGMINRVVPRTELETATMAIAEKIAAMPRMALTLTKKAVNFAEDEMGLRRSLENSFALHQLAHASSAETSGSATLGVTPSHSWPCPASGASCWRRGTSWRAVRPRSNRPPAGWACLWWASVRWRPPS